MPDTRPRLDCRRHAALVAAAIVGIVVAKSAALHAPIPWEFACYGALHAATLALCMRPKASAVRSLAFVVGTACLSFLLARASLLEIPRAPLTVIAVSAFAGAIGYGALLRGLIRYRLAPGTLALIAFACLFAACASLVLVRQFPKGGGVWLAALWWIAFSAGLCADATKQRMA